MNNTVRHVDGQTRIRFMEGLDFLSVAHFLHSVKSIKTSKMNTLEEPTIEEEIISVDRIITSLRELVRSHGPDSKRTPIYKAKIKYSREKKKVLQSLLEEQAAGWEIVFLQPQNDHDEVWKSSSPGPRIAKLLPESHKLGKCPSESILIAKETCFDCILTFS